jgi:hypothetical protein
MRLLTRRMKTRFVIARTSMPVVQNDLSIGQPPVTQNDTQDYIKQIEFNEETIYRIELIRQNGAQGRDRTTDTAIFSQSTDCVIPIDIDTFARSDV